MTTTILCVTLYFIHLGHGKFDILHFNCGGLNNYIKRRELFSWIKDQKVDIVLLQETFCTK